MANDPSYLLLLEQARYARTEAQLVAAYQNVDALFVQAIRILGVPGAESENSVKTIRSRLESAARQSNVDEFNAFIEQVESAIRDAVDSADATKSAKFKLIAEALWSRYQIQVTNGVLEFSVIGKGDEKTLSAIGAADLSWAALDGMSITRAPQGVVEQTKALPPWAIGAIAATAAYFLLS